MILVRYILIIIIGYLIIRFFIADKRKMKGKNQGSSKKISKETGEYIDYEEIIK
jgi:hypothetical protein